MMKITKDRDGLINPGPLTILLCLSAALFLWSCAPTPVQPDPPAEDEIRSMADSAELLRETGDPAEAAEIYEDIAGRVTEADRAQWVFRAMDAWIEADNLDRARNLGRSFVPTEMSRPDRFRLAIRLARADLAENRPRQALARLDVRAEGVPMDVLPELLAVRGEAHFRLEDVIDGISDLQRRADLLEGENRLEAMQTLWDRLLGLPTLPERDAAEGRPLIAGWLNLARAGQESWQRPDQFDQAVAEWESLHRDHPARELMDKLLAEHRERFRYPERIALILPLSGRLSAPAEAVRDGLLAAHFNQPGNRRPDVRIYDSGPEDIDIIDLYRQAVDDGAGLVVGPLTRPALSRLGQLEERPVPVLGLNYLADDTGSEGLYQFGLSPESEAAQVAGRVVREGHEKSIALVPDSDWGYRMLDAYRAELEALDAALLDYETFRPEQRDFSARITRVLGLDRSRDRHQRLERVLETDLGFSPRRRQDMSAIFLAAQEQQAALIRPQLRFHHAIGVPVFAPSSVYNPGQEPNSDLDGIRFADMPWSIAREGEAQNARERVSTLWPDLFNQHGRLFALGFDAYRLVPILMNFEDPLDPPLAAMTGVLSLEANQRIERELGWARFSNGRPVPLEPIEETDESGLASEAGLPATDGNEPDTTGAR